jgi:hypothetical protein
MPNPDPVRSLDPDRGEEIVDATLVDTPPLSDPRPVRAMQLVRRERRSEVLRPLDREQLVASFREYQELCKQLLDDSDYQRDGDRTFKKKSAWRKLATAFDLDVEIIREHVDRDPTGQPVRAAVIARAIAPSGRFQDGDGYCSTDEPRFEKPSGRRKLENDLRATAATRAKNRAISDLLGTGEVSAEEITSDNSADGPPYGPPVADAIAKHAGTAAVKLAGGDPHAGVALWKTITGRLAGYMPHAAATALLAAADAQPAGNGPRRASHGDPRSQTAARHATRQDTPATPEPAAASPAAPQRAVEGEPAPDPDEIARLQDRALELWGQLVPAEEAVRKVHDAHGDLAVLRILVSTAQRNLANRDRSAS